MELKYNRVYNTDCLIGMKRLPNNSVDAIITDPPYELGFMGKKWDSSGIAYNVDVWKEAFRVLKPGAHLLSFGGSRTYHRMACAIEDAGFEIRDQIMWVYGSGFPKSLNIGKAIDMLQGNEREIVGVGKSGKPESYTVMNMAFEEGSKSIMGGEYDITAPSSIEAKEWEGWGTALKPAHEPIVMARKPFKGTVAENVLKWGTGGINIDECRIETPDGKPHYGQLQRVGNQIYGGGKGTSTGDCLPANPNGRFPANLIHDGSDIVCDVFPTTKTGGGDKANKQPKERDSQCPSAINGGNWETDVGSASRFFKSCPQTEMDATFYYCAKASKSERNKGCDQIEAQKGIRTNAPRDSEDDKTPSRKNNHPTVKPLTLIEYLITLTTREGAIVLDPFMGSGTTAVASINRNRHYIGFELSAEYIPIIEARTANAKLLKHGVNI